jgi:quinol-cytochrome oxidoreductase complex cytochrome b subunit
LTAADIEEKKKDVDRRSAETSGQMAKEPAILQDKIAAWFDSRLGLSYPFLRDAPAYSINPFYWLGALTVVAFVIQGVTGIMMMLYYVPSPTQAYSSTQFIFQSVSYGRFLETVHLYTAYAMIMLAFMHMMRGYFVSVYKKPREIMWIVGMIMGFVTLGFGFTGYLLPWTVVSYSATHVGIGMISALPQPFSAFITFLIEGTSGDSGVLLRFYDLHVVVLPAVLLLLLVTKMYMLEAHGISPPPGGLENVPQSKRKLIPIFPDVTFYLIELAALFGAAMLFISAVFPLTLPPQYTPELAAQYTSQPDWYFLWIYQILKMQVFETYGLPVALSIITLILVILVILPFIDRGEERSISRRTKFVTLGSIFVAEVIGLSIWGELTPGQVIPNEQGVLILGGIALLVTLGSITLYRILGKASVIGRKRKAVVMSPGQMQRTIPPPEPLKRSAVLWTAGSFAALLGLSTLAIGSSINTTVVIIVQGVTQALVESLALSLAGLSISVFAIIFLLYRLELGSGSLKRRIKFFEIGWNKE